MFDVGAHRGTGVDRGSALVNCNWVCVWWVVVWSLKEIWIVRVRAFYRHCRMHWVCCTYLRPVNHSQCRFNHSQCHIQSLSSMNSITHITQSFTYNVPSLEGSSLAMTHWSCVGTWNHCEWLMALSTDPSGMIISCRVDLSKSVELSGISNLISMPIS